MDRPRLRAVVVLAALGAVWGAAAYQILWGYTSIVTTRSFVDSPLGLLSLFPARIVLFAIHLVEDDVVHHGFDFSRNHAWIGVVTAVTGALVLALPFAAGGVVLRAARRRG